jgi:hypothetical protein
MNVNLSILWPNHIFPTARKQVVDRQFRLPRMWSNAELRRLAPLFGGDVVNVSAWEDMDKEGSTYESYFAGADTYAITNFRGARGSTGRESEILLDLTAPLERGLEDRFDVVLNHTTLEHIFDVRAAFANLCTLSRDVVIVIVPFAQAEHDTPTWGDYWRFTPRCLRELFQENGLEVVYESASPHENAGLYLLAVGSRRPEHWRERLPDSPPIDGLGAWIGRSPVRDAARSIGRRLSKLLP